MRRREKDIMNMKEERRREERRGEEKTGEEERIYDKRVELPRTTKIN